MERVEGFSIIRVYRQITVRHNIVNQESTETTSLTQAEEEDDDETEGRENKDRIWNAIILLILYAMGLTSIIIGSLHLNDCPIQKHLPRSLAVFGGLLITIRLIKCVYDFRSVCDDFIKTEDEAPECLSILEIFFIIAAAGAVIAMAICVFTIKPTTNPDDHLLPNYCDYVLYNSSWYLSIVGLIIFVTPVLCACCI